MSITLALSALALAQSSLAALPATDRVMEREVAYETLAQGQAADAVAKLEAMRAETPGDPALLINLGSAYAEMGDAARAEYYYKAAMTAEESYQLELADGRWVDSRDAASLALAALERPALALK